MSERQHALLKYIAGYQRINIGMHPIIDEADTLAHNVAGLWAVARLTAKGLIAECDPQPEGADGLWVEITAAGRAALEPKP